MKLEEIDRALLSAQRHIREARVQALAAAISQGDEDWRRCADHILAAREALNGLMPPKRADDARD